MLGHLSTWMLFVIGGPEETVLGEVGKGKGCKSWAWGASTPERGEGRGDQEARAVTRRTWAGLRRQTALDAASVQAAGRGQKQQQRQLLEDTETWREQLGHVGLRREQSGELGYRHVPGALRKGQRQNGPLDGDRPGKSVSSGHLMSPPLLNGLRGC